MLLISFTTVQSSILVGCVEFMARHVYKKYIFCNRRVRQKERMEGAVEKNRAGP